MTNTIPLPSLEKFDLEGDSTSMAIRWERWKRSLLIYLDAAEVASAPKKRATLLHLGGSGVQEIFYNLPGANVEPSGAVDVFKIAIEKLDEYFQPKQSKVYERHIFRLLKQEEGEKFEKFLIRLRQQAGKCAFEKQDDHLIDQIAEKCNLSELRKKILTLGDSVTLDKIITEANTLEVVNQQLEDYGNKNKNLEINLITKDNRKFSKGKNYQNQRQYNKKKVCCGRCGSNDHVSSNASCPALGKKCHSCGKVGHFRLYCRSTKNTEAQKRKIDDSRKEENNQNNWKKSKTSKEKDVDSIETEEIDYVFQVDNDGTIKCSVGGIEIDMLIDSGCRLNLLTDKTWEELKNKKVQASNLIKRPNKTLLAYGSNTPLTVEGSFETTVEVDGRKELTTIYVISGGTRNLLGKNTATHLGVLKLGIGINQVEITPFPKFKGILVEIPVDDSIKPVSQPCRRVPIPIEEKVTMKIRELLDSDIIEEVQGPSKWVSPIVPIMKGNGELRLCVDMRRANAAIMRENHPLPSMDHFLPKMKKAKYFSKLDIKNAFHQVEIHPESRHITTFITSTGLYRYKRLMFGITCAPEIFQKIIEKMLINCEGVVNFIDDILIFGDSEDEHDARLKRVLQILNENNAVLNRSKCIFKTQDVSFLGHKLNHEGVKPLDKYVESIKSFRVPKTIEELQSFLGLVNYINKWIPNLATMTEPLKQLLRQKMGKRDSLEKLWSEEQNKAFQKLKQMLTKIQSLGYYDVQDATQVIADASPVGLGAVLVQNNAKGPRIIAYGNRTLTDCERRYSQTEKEALALVWAVEHFNIFLFGKPFDLITDHKPLEILFGPKSKPCARIERWVLRLQSYKFKVVYKPGKTNIADPLSRLCYYSDNPPKGEDQHVQQIVENSRPVAIPMSSIVAYSEKDQEICNVKKGVYQNNWDDSIRSYKIFENELCFHGSILLRGNKIVIPQQLRKSVLDAAHEGHPGIVAMKGRLRSKVWWPRIDKDVENIVKACKGCTLVGLPNPPAPMKRRELPVAPWIDVAIDLMGPLPSNEYLLVVVDYYSRYKEVKITKTITSSQIIKILKEMFSRLGFPVSITADNGKQFVSEEFRSFCKECNIRLLSTVPYWPQMNGEVERQNRDILKRLRISQIEKKDLRESLWDYLLMYNSTPHTVTGRSPSELFFQRQSRDKIPSLGEINYRLDDSDIRDRDKIQKDKGKEYGDRKRRATESDIMEGDKVYVKTMEKPNKLTTNFNPTPHVVESARDGDCTVRNSETDQSFRRNVVHLKKVEGEWTTVPPDQNEEEQN